jgi:hypothetical protein
MDVRINTDLPSCAGAGLFVDGFLERGGSGGNIRRGSLGYRGQRVAVE